MSLKAPHLCVGLNPLPHALSHSGVQRVVRQLCSLTSCQLWDLGEYLLLTLHLALKAELKYNGHSSSC